MAKSPKTTDRVERRFIVTNPRGTPKGNRILTDDRQSWYEGDSFVPGPKTDVQELLELGYIKEVK